MNDRWFFVNPMLPTVLCMVAISVLSAFFLLLELRKKTRLLPLRLTTLLIMMLALVAIMVRPSFLSTRSNSIALLTPGYDPAEVDSLLNNRAATLVHLPKAEPHRKSEPLNAAQELALIAEEVDFVFGEGLSPAALDILGDCQFEFFPAAYPSGVISISIPDRVFRNRKNKIEGIYNQPAAKTTMLLEGPGGIEDSVIISGNDFTRFDLSFTPRSTGNILYKLISRDSSGKGNAEILPVTIREHEPSDILFIQQYPSFETQYLKTFLGKHHRLLLRYQLSQNTYRYESINRKLQRIGKLSAPALGEFDLLIIDSDVLRSLSTDEITTLQREIKHGLGMIILLNSPPQGNRRLPSFLSAEFKTGASDTAHVYFSNSKKVLSTWPVRIQSDRFIQGITSNKNRILSGYTFNGFGKVGFQLVQETYRQVLEGDSSFYSAIWSDLIEQTSRTSNKEYVITIRDPIPLYTDEPINASILSLKKSPELMNDGMPIAPVEDLLIDDVWHARSWAGEPGWHAMTITQDSTTCYYYIFENNAWKSLRVANALNQTALSSSSGGSEKGVTRITQAVPSWIFYLAFLISGGLLWLAPKL